MIRVLDGCYSTSIQPSRTTKNRMDTANMGAVARPGEQSAGTHNNGTLFEGPKYSADDVAPFIRTFLETLFGTLREDIAALKQDMATEIKDIKRELEDLGQRVVTLEQTNDSKNEELNGHRWELLEL
ncbi:hypothetical protein NDU88_008066 [Pleurodeles waltl]|uniref:Heat shock factor binding protein 1 n=1 Tax=Pleurodeles waltl TaxID=8319 RepID=A0AAV7PRT9_PLEWA|nr:hypothetical protein NDU88_008066 [Pleurodeles waltl]